MKTIFFPTDFSSTTDSALDYAIAFSRKLNAKLILFNTYPVPVYVTDMADDAVVEEHIRTLAETSLKNFEERIHSFAPDIETECLTSWGFPSDEIIFQSKEKKADLIIMGTHGANGFRKFLLGTNTAEVVNKAECPVLAVPEGYIYKDFSRIAFASDSQEEELPSIQTTTELATRFGASVTLVHVTDDVFNKKMEMSIFKAFREEVQKQTQFYGIEIETIEATDIIHALTEFVVKEDIDLLVLAHHKRNFMARLLHPSISKKIAYNLTSPLLTLPIFQTKPITDDSVSFSIG